MKIINKKLIIYAIEAICVMLLMAFCKNLWVMICLFIAIILIIIGLIRDFIIKKNLKKK